jgi:hypothetical protein
MERCNRGLGAALIAYYLSCKLTRTLGRYESSFAEDLGQFMSAMEAATALIDCGEEAVRHLHINAFILITPQACVLCCIIQGSESQV